MTAQASDRLIYDGKSYPLCEELLGNYFKILGEKSPFVAPRTSLWRGYLGRWEIFNDRLYLTGLHAWIQGYQEVNQTFLFPDFPELAFAHWVTGKLRATDGEQLEYVHGGFNSTYERDLIFDLEDGVLKSVNIKTNEPKEENKKRQ